MPKPAEAHTWTMRADRTLKSTLEEWASKAGWTAVIWIPSDPYHIETSYFFHGTFINAILQVNEFVPTLDFQLSLSKRTILVTPKSPEAAKK